MTSLEMLKTARENVAAKILQISVNPRPTYSVDGQSMQHGDFLSLLLESHQLLGEQIAVLEPYNIVTQVL